MDPTAPNFDALVAEDAFVRRLARRLVVDAATADDVAQDAFAAALRRPPRRDATSWRAWFAVVVRRIAAKARRTSDRRAARETEAARAEAIPSTADYVAREQARRRLVDAVFALREPLRTTVLLRWFEDLPPRVVARRLAVPVETVRTRLKTAARLLRAALDDGYGGERRAWLGLLAPFALPRPGAAFGAAVETAVLKGAGVVAMTAKSKSVALAVLVLLCGVASWRLATSEAPRDGGSSAFASTDGGGETAAAPPPTPPKSAPSRPSEPVASAPFEDPASRGTDDPPTLVVRAVATSDDGPVADLAIDVIPQRGGDGDLRSLRGRTDARGVMKITPAPAGPVLLYADTGANVIVDVAPAGETAATLRVHDATRLSGRVVDAEGRGVADADVYVCKGSGGVRAPATTRTDAEGRFAVIGAPYTTLAATAPGYAPSASLLVVGAGEGGEILLVLPGPGARVVGRCVDARGAPVAALVRMAPRPTTEPAGTDASGRVRMSPPYRFAACDAEGRFAFEGAAPGEGTLTARASGGAAADVAYAVAAGATSEVRVVCTKGAAVAGVVRRSDGGRASGVVVRVAESTYDPLRHLETETDATGAFRISGLSAEDVALEIDDPDAGYAIVPLPALVDGAEHDAEITLRAGGAAKIRVLDELGAPLANAHVTVEAVDATPATAPAARLRKEGRTGPDGRAVIAARAEGRHRATVVLGGVDVPPPVVGTVVAGGEEIVLTVALDRAPRTVVVGRVVDARGAAASGKRISAATRGVRASVTATTDAEGRFRIEGVRAGSVDVFVGLMAFGPYPAAGGATLDVGVLALAEPGALVLSVRGPDGEVPFAGAECSILDGEGRRRGVARLAAGKARTPLAPGAYVVRVPAVVTRGAEEDRAFVVAAGSDVVVDATVARGVDRSLGVRCPRRFTVDDPALLRVEDDARRVLFERPLTEFSERPGLSMTALKLPEGRLRVVVVHQGASGEAVVDVRADAPSAPAILIEVP